MNKKYLAECVGTFGLALLVTLAVDGSFPLPVPILAGLFLALSVYSIGHISGCHINPAVTLGLLSIKKIQLKDAMSYIVAQLVGAFGAMMMAQSVGVRLTPQVSGMLTFGVAEAIGTAFFTFGIASVVYGRAEKSFSGIVVGGSLLLGIAFAALLGSAGVLNPAVALSLSLFTPMYVLGPIFGSLLGFNLYTWLDQQK